MKKVRKSFNINKNVLLLVIAVPLLVAIGVIAGSFVTNPDTMMASNNEEPEEVEEVSVALEEFVLNLEPTNNVNRYVRMEISLSTTQEGGLELLEGSLDKIRDSIINTVSRQTVNDIFDEEVGTSNLKDVLKESLNAEFEDELVHQVYITNVVVQ